MMYDGLEWNMENGFWEDGAKVIQTLLFDKQANANAYDAMRCDALSVDRLEMMQDFLQFLFSNWLV